MKTREALFWQKVDKTSDNGCWNWTASKNERGYGQFWDGRKMWKAHRYAYSRNQPIDAGALLDHRCHNPGCVNPSHLRQVTHKQNMENQLGAHCNSASGVRGVYFDSSRNRWRARLQHQGAQINVGSFATLHEAELAVRSARNKLFTHNDADRA